LRLGFPCFGDSAILRTCIGAPPERFNSDSAQNKNQELNVFGAVKNLVILVDYPFQYEAQTALFKYPVRTALYTLFILVIKTNQFML
jgi:hypothetical protein